MSYYCCLKSWQMFWKGSYWNWRTCWNPSYPGYRYFPSFWIQDKILPLASSRCCQHLGLWGAKLLKWWVYHLTELLCGDAAEVCRNNSRRVQLHSSWLMRRVPRSRHCTWLYVRLSSWWACEVISQHHWWGHGDQNCLLAHCGKLGSPTSNVRNWWGR